MREHVYCVAVTFKITERVEEQISIKFCIELEHSSRNYLDQGVKLIFIRGHISLMVAFKGPNIILGLYKCNYYLTRGKDIGSAAGKQGAGPDKTRWRAGFSPRALCLPPVF